MPDNSCLEELWQEFPGFTQYEVRAALAKCGLTTKHIESKVKVLSGGEQAKVRLCKLINRGTNILLLDDTLSAVDAHTETAILTSLKDEMSGRTAIIVAHRLSAVENCDEILYMENGSVVERGTHEQLIAQGGKYYQLYTGAFELE